MVTGPMRRRSGLLLGPVLSLLLLGLIAPQPAAAADAAVTITWTLEPAQLTIPPNTSVTWTNTDGARHRMRATSGPVDFDSGSLETGESFSFTFTEIGTYQYRDDRNPDLSNYWGTIIVEDGAGGGGSPPAGADVRMAGRVFRPQTITIQPGESVVFLNDDGRDHTVTARDRSFDSGIMAPGSDYVRTFPAAGTYEYFCAIHPDMIGTVVVEGPGGQPPPPSPPPSTPVPPPPGDVSIIDFEFGPATLTVAAGSTVAWVNAGAALHTVTARDGAFDSGFLSSGDTYARTFATSGTYEYFCTLHPDMVGTVLVTGSGGEPPPPAPPGPAPPPVPGDLSIVDFAYQPGTIRVPAGTTLTWANNGVAPHTVTSRSGLFDSGIVASGGTYAHTFSAPGTYQYFCTLHPDMAATVIVPSSTGEVPPPASAPPPPPAAQAGDVQMIDFAYTPASFTVAQGSTVTWVNTGVALHTATSRAFDSGFLNTGDSFSFRFQEAGTFQYFCTLHPGMTGTISVAAADGTVPAGAPDAGAGEPSTAAGPRSADIDMLDFSFAPVDFTVPVGTAATWVNRGAALHTATARDGSFDSGFLSTGESFTLALQTPGVFEYFCIIHPGMTGTITVVSANDQNPGAVQTPGPGNASASSRDSPGLPESQSGVDRVFAALFAILGVYFLLNVARAFGLGDPRRPS